MQFKIKVYFPNKSPNKMSKPIKILLISIFAGSIFSILSLSNNQNSKEISQAVESGVTMTSTIAGLLISLKDSNE